MTAGERSIMRMVLDKGFKVGDPFLWSGWYSMGRIVFKRMIRRGYITPLGENKFSMTQMAMDEYTARTAGRGEG